MTHHVAVIDYGMGNLHSVAKALEHAGATKVTVSHEPEAIAEADRVVFPGVGGIRDCMEAIRRLGCDELLDDVLSRAGKPVLAICVGMQALMTRSDENEGIACLDWVPGEVRFFGDAHRDEAGTRLKVPHMGWNTVALAMAHPLWHGIEPGERFYFVHSYHIVPRDPSLALFHTDYGGEFVSGICSGNCYATQFHPEKSQAKGLHLYRNFLRSL